MAPERTFYLDAGPVVAIICEDDMFHRATKTAMSTLSGRKVTSMPPAKALPALRGGGRPLW